MTSRAQNAAEAVGLLLVVVMLGCMVACTQPPFAKTPPAKYRQPGWFVVATHPTGSMPTVCTGASTVGETVSSIAACFNGAAVQMPNPCEWPDDNYASLFCHELAHAQGWPADHPDR